MIAHSTPADRWPSRFAFASAAIFTLASTGTNLLYGLSKGTDLASSIVWASVSVAVSLVFALSWPALIRATDAKQNARAFIILVGLLLTGSFSVSAALGSAYGGRVQAATVQADHAGARSKAESAYKRAESELTALAPARPAAELEPQIRSLKATRRANNCETRDGPVSRKYVGKPMHFWQKLLELRAGLSCLPPW